MLPKILIVDDREDNLFAIETLLAPDGYHFVKATSGREVLKILLTDYNFALILMDVKMPNLDGFETAMLIYEREKLKHIPIIFITAHTYDEENIFRGYKSGAVDYIYKPINPDLLRAKVSVYIDLYKKNHQLLAQEQKLTNTNRNLQEEITERKNSENQLAELYESLRLKNTELQEINEELLYARKQLADDLTRFLVQAMPHIVATTDAEGALNFCNQHLIDYTGYNFEELKGMGWVKFIHPDDKERLLISWFEALSAGIGYQMEFRVRKANGEYFWHLGLVKPFMDDQKFVNIWIITLTDIHDQKMMDEKKNEFISLASHELKTPLTSAKAYTQLLEQIMVDNDESEAMLYVKKANASINRLDVLITELLDINKIQQGKLEFLITEFDFNDVIAEAVEHINQTFAHHKIECTGSINKLITGDENKIHQVCVNLLSNAIKYSPKAERVLVSFSIVNNNLSVAVKDFGIGIPKSDQEKIFNKFYRVHGMTDQFQGLGLGLYLCSEIIKHHKGKIWVESELGLGSTFHFTIPLILNAKNITENQVSESFDLKVKDRSV